MCIDHLVLDRDGVLLVEDADGGYLTRCEDMHWVPGALAALRLLKKRGLRVSIATNQSGVGRGLMTEQTLERIHERLRTDVEEAGGRIDAIMVCPHAPDQGCACRKPSPGLIEDAIRSSGIPAEATLVVGDATRDIEAAHAAGVRAALVRTGKGICTERDLDRPGVEVFDDVLALAHALARRRPAASDHGPGMVRQVFDDHLRVLTEAARLLHGPLQEAAHHVCEALERGNKVLACGNGGSAADAEHLVAELVGRFRVERPPLAAIALSSGSATMTALANDYGYDQSFARQVRALARTGDVLLAISTSGNSPSVVAAAEQARSMGCLVVALTGATGGAVASHADLVVRIPSNVTARVQEGHGVCVHAIAECVDQRLADPSDMRP